MVIMTKFDEFTILNFTCIAKWGKKLISCNIHTFEDDMPILYNSSVLAFYASSTK